MLDLPDARMIYTLYTQKQQKPDNQLKKHIIYIAQFILLLCA